MQQVDYNYRKLAKMLAGTAFLAMLSLAFASATGRWIGVVAAVIFVGCALLAARGLLVGRPALRFDEREVTISTLIGSQTVPWSLVRDIRIETMTLMMYGFIPTGRHEYLTFHVAGGFTGTRKIRLTSDLFDQSRTLPEICVALSAARLGSAAPAAAAAAAPIAEPASTAEGECSGFDPDAAIARYLAHKAKADAAPAPPFAAARPTFGRKVS